MNIIGPLKDQYHEYFVQAIWLYEMSFPREERCPRTDFIHRIQRGENELYVVIDENRFIGFYTQWHFSSFEYIEHLAIVPDVRSKGYGSRIMRSLMENAKQPVVLEIERPYTQMGIARLKFYERLGFEIISDTYIQPPYECNQSPVEMYLMCYAAENRLLCTLEEVVETLYAKVYHTEKGAFSV